MLVRESRCFSWSGPTIKIGKSCCWRGNFSACWCGKVGIEVGGSQLEGRTKRVGFVATFRRVGAGKATLKVVVSSWGYEYPKCPACRRTIGRVRTLGVMWTACQRRRCSSCEASDTPPAAPPTPPAEAHDSDRAGCPRISHAIPPPPCRVIHSHRWNRNVCRCC